MQFIVKSLSKCTDDCTLYIKLSAIIGKAANNDEQLPPLLYRSIAEMMFAFKFEMAFYTGLVAGYNLFPTTCFELNILERMELELNLDTEINYISLPEF